MLKILQHRNALVNQIKRLAIEAGEIVLEDFDESGSMATNYAFLQKTDGSPVTDTDQKAQDYIFKKLQEITPDLEMIGEEVEQREKISTSDQDYIWVVDPIDGTKDFIEGSKDFTVNIGLIYKGKPILGVIYAPALGELYSGFTNDDGEKLATRWLEESKVEKDIRVRTTPKEGLVVVTGRINSNGKTSQKIEEFANQFKIQKVLRRSSSIKLCMIASGKADIYPRFGKSSIWDIAAGQAILEAAGGEITDFKGQDIPYPNRENNFENPEFVAWSGKFELFEKE